MRALLLERQHALRARGDLEIIPEGAEDEGARNPDEDAQPLAEMGQVIASRRNRERAEQLTLIHDALERLKEDPEEFGLCEECGDPVPPKRLELMPWVRLCIPCQEIVEREQAASAGRKHITDYKV